MERPQARPNLPALTGLRFFAAFVVVAFHYNPDRFVNMPEFFRSWLETGYEAVTFFFVLSGFIMSYMYSDFGQEKPRKINLRSFFVARFARLAPAYYLALLIALPFFIGDAFVWEHQPIAEFASQALLVPAFLQSWWPPAALAWNPPGWSISVEWCLYAAFPLLAVVSHRMSGRRMLLVSFVFVAVVAGFRLRVMGPLVEENPAWHNFAQYFPLFHLPTFYSGMALGRMQLTGPRPSPQVAGWLCLASMAVLLVKYSGVVQLPPGPLTTDTVLVLLFGMLIMGAAQAGHFAQRALSWVPLIFLGEISYSMYALHEPIAMWWEKFRPDIYGTRLAVAVEFPTYFAIVLVASTLCYYYVEAPLRRLIRRWAA